MLRLEAEIRDRYGSDKLEKFFEHTTTTTQNSTNSCDSVDVLALAPHSAVEVAGGIHKSINYTAYIMST